MWLQIVIICLCILDFNRFVSIIYTPFLPYTPTAVIFPNVASAGAQGVKLTVSS